MTETTTTSPADELRQAAALMRERAEQATPGPWRYEPELFDGSTCAVLSDSPKVELPWGALVVEPGMTEQARRDAGHIAGWHPAVALAVAAWLDNVARHLDVEVEYGPTVRFTERAFALRVARTYLGTAVEAVAR